MLKYLILLCSCAFSLFSSEITISATKGDSPPGGTLQPVPITLEYAETPQQISWGLMKRPFIPDNHGLMIIYPEPLYASIWMFNTYINLSVAFLDNNKIIREIYDLQAVPEMMDPDRPVESIWDISKYYSNESIVKYYTSNQRVAKTLTSYAFEMNMGWFKNNGFGPGDVLFWQPFAKQGSAIHTWDVGVYQPGKGKPVVVDPAVQYPFSVSLITSASNRDIAFLDLNNKVIAINTLPGGKYKTGMTRAVAYTTVPVDKVVVAIEGELVGRVRIGDTINIHYAE